MKMGPDQIRPITPEQASAKTAIPDFVIACFNTLIERNFNGVSSSIQTDEVVAEIMKRCTGSIAEFRNRIFDEKWLNVERLFRDYGWEVSYEKYDDGSGQFIFKVKSKEFFG